MQKVKLIKPHAVTLEIRFKTICSTDIKYTIIFIQPGSQACEFLSISR